MTPEIRVLPPELILTTVRMVAPALGFALFFVCIIAGQLGGSTLVDQLGVFGLPVKPASTMKLAGLAMVLAGAVLVQFGNN